MVQSFGKRRGEITSVFISGGTIVCSVEDKDNPNREYKAILTSKSINQFDLPPVGTEVIVEQIKEEIYITHIISTTSTSGISDSDGEHGALNDSGSVSFVFDQRDGADGPEKLSIEYRDGGYKVDLDVDGDVSINAGGDVTITEGGTAKKVLTEDAKFEYEDTGDTSDGNSSATTKKTTTVVNGEKTEVELE